MLSDDRIVVQRALSSLPPEQRLAIELAYFGGYTQQEIAAGLRALGLGKGDHIALCSETRAEFYILEQSKRTGIRVRFERRIL